MTSRRSVLAAGLALAATLYIAPAAAQDPVELKFASFVSPKSITNSVTIPAFIKAVEEASEGTLKIKHFPGGTLGSSPATQLKLIEDGVVDIAEVVAVYTPGRFPELELFELPFVFNSSREAGLTAWKMYEKGLFPSFENLAWIGLAEVGPYTLHTRKPAKNLAGFKGMKLRAGGPVQGKVVKGLGAIPVGGISATKIAENISRRVLDGSLMDDGNLFNFRIADAARYHVPNVQLGHVAVIFPMNKAKYESLPPKAKAALDKYRGVWFTDMVNSNLDKQIQNSLEKMNKDPKHTMSPLSDAELATLKSRLASIKDPWDKKNSNGHNLYREMLAALESVRKGQ